MRYLVREGAKPKAGIYWTGTSQFLPNDWAPRPCAMVYRSEDIAKSAAKRYGGRVVRLLSHEEAKRKHLSVRLREIAADAETAGFAAEAEFLRNEADNEWPAPKRKAARRG